MNLFQFAHVAYFVLCSAFVFSAIYREKKMRIERDTMRKKYETELGRNSTLEAEIKKIRNAKIFIRIPRAQIDKAMLN